MTRCKFIKLAFAGLAAVAAGISFQKPAAPRKLCACFRSFAPPEPLMLGKTLALHGKPFVLVQQSIRWDKNDKQYHHVVTYLEAA